MSQLWAKSGTYEFDDNGERALGAQAYFFAAGTSTPYPVYEDADETEPHTHPVEADGNGRWPAVFVPFGTYKVLITDSGGSTLITIDDIPNPAPADPGEGVDANAIFQTGDMILVGKNGTRSGFVRCNGRTIGSATSGASERANADCENLFTYVWNNSTTLRAAMAAGAGASAAADWAANKTIPLPDARSAALIGFDDMGNSAAGLAGSAPVVSGSAILAGSIIGANTHTILEAQLPAHAHSVSITSGAGSAHTHGTGTFATVAAGGHTHTGSATPSGSITGAFSYNNTECANGPGTDTTNVQVNIASESVTITDSRTWSISTSNPGDHSHTFSGALANESAHTHSVSGNTGNIGSGTAHNIMARSAPVTVLMKL